MNSTGDREPEIPARIVHREASERGGVDLEHAIYAADAILDYPQSGDRFTGPHETQYFADPFPASPARAALAEPIPAGKR
jgi:hypothetical protein